MNNVSRYILQLDRAGRCATWEGKGFSLPALRKGHPDLPELDSIYVLRTKDGIPFYVGETNIGLRRNFQEFRFPKSDFSEWRHNYGGQEILADHYTFDGIQMRDRQFRRFIEAKLIGHFPNLRNRTDQLPRDPVYHVDQAIVDDCIAFVA